MKIPLHSPLFFLKIVILSLLLNPFFIVLTSPSVDAEIQDTSQRTSEGKQNHTNFFRLTLNTASGLNTSVSYQTRDGTAKAGEDYIATSGIATIPAGEKEVLIGVEILTDTKIEQDETFHLVLTQPNKGQFPNRSNEVIATHTIVNTDNTPPVISINGANSIEITQGQNYIDAGATANDDINGVINVSQNNTVNTATIGTYTVTYTATDSTGNTTTATRTVNVVQTPDTEPPIISLNGTNPVEIIQGQNYDDAGASAIDHIDGVVNIVKNGSVNSNTIGSYILTYTAIDTAGNITTATRTINVVQASDTEPPLITLNGTSPMEIIQGQSYNELGAIAIDNRDGAVNVITTGSVDPQMMGTYTLIYTAIDEAGNTASIHRIVTVTGISITNPKLLSCLENKFGYLPSQSELQTITSLHCGFRNLNSNDITEIQQLTSLEELMLIGNQITDLSSLSSLVQLRELTLIENQVNDLTPISNLTQLTRLSLDDNRLVDISPLNFLTQLESLNLRNFEIGQRNNNIKDISSLSTLNQLTYLDLGNNQISDITPLKNLSLVSLSIGGNQIDNLTPLSSLSQLLYLNLDNSDISDLQPIVDILIPHHQQLLSLSLQANRITDVTPLSALTQLTDLYFGGIGNCIDDYTPVAFVNFVAENYKKFCS